MDVDEFRQRLYLYLSEKSVVYTLEVNSDKPAGIVTGVYMGPFLYMDDVIWFPWASKRNKYESTVHALNELRKEYSVMVLSPMKDKEFFVQVARHGVIRRVGTVYDAYSDGPGALFQTRNTT